MTFMWRSKNMCEYDYTMINYWLTQWYLVTHTCVCEWVNRWFNDGSAPVPLRWRHNDHAGVSNHQPHGCLLNRLFRLKSKITSKLRVTGLCAGNSPGTGEFPAQMASYAENVSIWWCHHAAPINQLNQSWIFLSIGCFSFGPLGARCKPKYSNFYSRKCISRYIAVPL